MLVVLVVQRRLGPSADRSPGLMLNDTASRSRLRPSSKSVRHQDQLAATRAPRFLPAGVFSATSLVLIAVSTLFGCSSGPGLGTPDLCCWLPARAGHCKPNLPGPSCLRPRRRSYMALARSLLPTSPAAGVYMLVFVFSPSVSARDGAAAPVPLPSDGVSSILVVRVIQGGHDLPHPPGAATWLALPFRVPPRW